jgi:NDP-sugar pyrophosphorylase family protein
MQQSMVRQVPLLDEEDRVVDLLTFEDLVPEQRMPVQAVIMAGGLGKRLRPLTDDLPKPMLPIGGEPLMERTIRQLRDTGIHRVHVTTHYRPEKVMDHFGDGSNFGVQLNYVTEEQPLGTAGALGLLDTPSEPLLVINGDIITAVDYRALFAFHREHEADLTVAVRQYELQVPYGVIHAQDALVSRVEEKPQLQFLVNAGIYLLEPGVFRYIPRSEHLDMPDLIHRLVEDGRTVVSFPVREYWLDIGQLADYERAQQDVLDGVIQH